MHGGIGGKPFANHLVLGVQHLLGAQLALFRSIEELGAEARDITMLGVPYSTSELVESIMMSRGYRVDYHDDAHRHGVDYHAMRESHLRRLVPRLIAEAQRTGKRILVLDDGGIASRVVMEHFREQAHLFSFVEQTSRGITEAKTVEMLSPLVDVARSDGKTLESVYIAHRAVECLMAELSHLGTRNLEEKNVCLFGYGRVGYQVAIYLRQLGFDVTVIEKDDEGGRRCLAEHREELAELGVHATTDRDAVLGKADIVIGCSGYPVMDLKALGLLKSGAIVSSTSSAEVEFDMNGLRNAGVCPYPRARGETAEYLLDGKSLVVLKDGRPLNFTGSLQSVRAEYIQLTMALMLLGAWQAAQASRPGIQPLGGDNDEVTRAHELLIDWIKRRLPQQPEVDLRSLASPPPEPQPVSGALPYDYPFCSARRNQWLAFLDGCAQVVPRTREGRQAVHGSAFRREDGTWAWVQLNMEEPSYSPVPLPPLGADLLTAASDGEVLRVQLTDGRCYTAPIDAKRRRLGHWTKSK